METYYIRWRGKISGPIAKEHLIAMAKSGQVTKHHSVSSDRILWTPAGEIDWLLKPAPPPPMPEEPGEPVEEEIAPQAAGQEAIPVGELRVFCTSCGQELSVEDRYAGRDVQCPSCKAIVRVPGGQQAAPEQEPAPQPSHKQEINLASMVYCRECGKHVHASARACPHCGAPVRRGSQGKSKTVAGVLALFLGGLGVHRFYLGQWWGLFYLLFFWTFIPPIVAFVEGIVFLCTADEAWEEKYG
jgi:TM2 domain-containing membrane protein YozV/DNA-directed RNA polymerase subunit RPC12/RpoP